MRQKYFYLIAALATAMLSLSSCINDEMQVPEPDEIRISSGLEIAPAKQLTRSATDGFAAAFVAAENVDLFLIEHNAAANPYAYPMVTTVDTDNKTLKFTTTQYWPVSGNSVHFIGWYPSNKVGNDPTATDVSFAVEANQASTINTSDLMRGLPTTPLTNPVSKANKVELTFTHLLSKVVVILNPATASGVTAADLQNATVSLGDATTGVKTTVEISELKTAAATITTQASPTSPITILDGSSTSLTGYAIIPAQDLGGIKLHITLKGGAVLEKALPTSDANYVTSKGNVNTYTITVSRTELVVEGVITPWGTGTTGTQTIDIG